MKSRFLSISIFSRTFCFVFVPCLFAGIHSAWADIDPSLQGSWRFAGASRQQVNMLTLTISPDGSYRLSTLGPNKTPDETGKFQFDAGRWSLKSDLGRTDSGSFETPEQGALQLNGQQNERVWFRHVDSAPVAAIGAGNAAASAFDPRLVGAWRCQSSDNRSARSNQMAPIRWRAAVPTVKPDRTRVPQSFTRAE